MNEKKLKAAKALINTGMILRLLLIAVMAVYWAYSYTYPSILIKIHYEPMDIPIWLNLLPIILVFLIDIFLTINWKRLDALFYIEFIFYFFYSRNLYFFYLGDTYNTKNLRTSTEYISFSNDYISVPIILASLWVAGLIPFILCWIGKIKLKKARAGQKQINR